MHFSCYFVINYFPMFIRFIFFIGFVFLIELYAFQAIKTLSRVKWVQYSYVGITILILAFILFSFTQFDRSVGQNSKSLFTFGLLLLVFIPKILLTLTMFGEDFYRIISGIISHFIGDNRISTYLPTRKKWVSELAFGLAIIPFVSLLYGMTIGKYNYKVLEETIYFKDLPQAFDGFKITHISDIHAGSLGNANKIKHAVKLINNQKADLILFTGDIVNTHAKEMDPWIQVFKEIHQPEHGKYAVLGNHDYGEYVTWPSEADKLNNFLAIKGIHRKIGFDLLCNTHVLLHKSKDSIALVGVENWGHNFKKAGDLNQAIDGLDPSIFKILMSHDPSHWEQEVKTYKDLIQLTLSGHTHGLQFGIEIPGVFKWSPVQYVYKQWAGLYESNQRYLYVNRGFGFHAYPGRVGIWPEITVLTLKKS